MTAPLTTPEKIVLLWAGAFILGHAILGPLLVRWLGL